ncbi:MAG: cytosolic protein [Comamonadaceae bacterium CG12_big_fil_rev_8_21_14_0_65_59_15]|nr:MAG: cytosolic protein [Comamonadaceae bacterium CG12_big_fil_rev_8_21_14_0_65_59_15]
MTTHGAPADDYDSPWKDILEHAFPEFMAYYFPAASAQIDWAQGHEFKNTELRQVVRDAELGKRFADALVRVTLFNGEESWVYIHIEVQGRRDPHFAQRMFTYNYRLYDRYACPIASMAVLADDDENWKPSHFSFDALGCTHTLHFPVVKLLERADSTDHLANNPNPFALVTAAHLQTRQTKHDTQARYTAKRTLVRLLYQHGWSRQRVLDLFAVLDWMMRLPDGLEQELWQDIEQIEGETRMKYVTSVERLAIERGLQQGLLQGMEAGKLVGKLEGQATLLMRQLTKRFGPLSPDSAQRLQTATPEQLELWADRILDAPTLAGVFDTH